MPPPEVDPSSNKEEVESNMHPAFGGAPRGSVHFFFYNRTRLIILVLSTLCLTLLHSNTLTLNFTVICMDDVVAAQHPNSSAGRFKDQSTKSSPMPIQKLAWFSGAKNYSSLADISEPHWLQSPSHINTLFSAIAAGALIGTFPIMMLVSRIGMRWVKLFWERSWANFKTFASGRHSPFTDSTPRSLHLFYPWQWSGDITTCLQPAFCRYRWLQWSGRVRTRRTICVLAVWPFAHPHIPLLSHFLSDRSYGVPMLAVPYCWTILYVFRIYLVGWELKAAIQGFSTGIAFSAMGAIVAQWSGLKEAGTYISILSIHVQVL